MNKKFFKRLFLRNVSYKVFSILLAIAIWYTVTVNSFESQSVGPIAVKLGVPSNFLLEEEATNAIHLVSSG